MRRFVSFGIFLILAGTIMGNGQDVSGNNQIIRYGTHVAFPEEDTFATYGYTFGDIVIFSYADSNVCRLLDPTGDVIWLDTLMEDGYSLVTGLTPEVYQIQGSGEFSVLTGDPFNLGVCCWFAVDQNSRPLSTKLLSVGPKDFVRGQNVISVFSYYNNTHVLIRDLDDDAVIWEGDLDSAEYYFQDREYNPPIAFSVEANKPVSAGTFSGVVGTYAPSFNGTFTGRDFMTYYQVLDADTQDINIVPWEDSINVVVTNLDDPADTIWEVFCEERGRVKARSMPQDIAIYIHSDKDISVSQTPSVGYDDAGTSRPAYLVRGIDRDGLGLGTEFYIPLLGSGIVVAEDTVKLHVISFEDNTEITLTRTPFFGTGEIELWEGMLNRGEFLLHNTATGNEGFATYHVVSSKPVATIGSYAGIQGSDFLPLWFAIHPDVAAVPSPQFHETECEVPTRYEIYIENNGNIWDVIDIYPTNSMAPDFVTALSDSLGGVLPDVNANSAPDTDTLAENSSFQVLADVTPSDTMPFGTVDTCFFNVVSFRENEKQDTAYLITTIREVAVEVNPDTLIFVYPGETGLFQVRGENTSLYREDTVNLTWSSTRDESEWPVRLTDIAGDDLQDTDGDAEPDIAGVQPHRELFAFQARVGVPIDALAGERDTLYLIGTSNNYPTRLYPEVIDTAVLIVQVEPAPAVQIRPDTTDSTFSGMPIQYPLEVFNFGNGSDVPRIQAVSINRPSWDHELLSKDGSSQLPDTDGDGVEDMGTMPGMGGLDTLILEVTPPYSALSGQFDSTIVYSYSAVTPSVYDSAIVVTKTRSIVELDIEPDSALIINPGQVGEYRVRVTNWGGAIDTVSIGSYPDPDIGWSCEILHMDDSPLVDLDGNGIADAGALDSAQTIELKVLITPPDYLGKIVGDFDTAMVEQRYVWIRTYFTDDPDREDDRVLLTTTFEPLLDIHNYPNPFSAGSNTTFAFSIPSAGYVTLRVYNRAGEHVRTLISEELGNDYYEMGGTFYMDWDGLSESGGIPAPGVYLYTLQWRDEDRGALLGTRKVTKAALLQP